MTTPRVPSVSDGGILSDSLFPDAASATESGISEKKIPLGTNLAGLSDWSTQWTFVDLMKMSRPWTTQNVTNDHVWDTGLKERIPTDENGYPLEVPFKIAGHPDQLVVAVIGNKSHPAGDYTFLYEGEGEFEFSNGVSYRDEGPGKGIVTLPQGHGSFHLTIKSSKKGNHLRNLRLIMPGFEQSYEKNPFHPLFLERLKGFGILRFMDLMHANHNPSTAWKERVTPTYYTQTGDKGMAIEYVAALTNATQANCWINIPHMVDDDYIRNVAKILFAELKPEKKIYLEYSNELWNTGAAFIQSRWLWEAGCKDPSTFVPYSKGDDWGIKGCSDGDAGANYHVKRLARIYEIFEEIFGKDFSQRIVKVVAGQAANRGVIEKLWPRFADPKLNPQGYKPDVYAIAPYFGGSVSKKIIQDKLETSITVEDILDLAEKHMKESAFKWIANNKAFADQNQVRLVTYEGGQSLSNATSSNDILTQKLIEANRHPRMGELYKAYYRYWFNDIKGGEFLHFSYVSNPTKYGSWGMLEYQDQPPENAPKFTALQDILKGLQ